MKKATKMLAWLLLAAMPVAGAAETNVIERPAASVGMERLERYPSHEMDAETGKWTVRSNPAEALLDRFWTYAETNASALCIFAVEAEGSALTGVWSPVLRFYYSGSKTLNASAVSVLADGVRYDLAASSEEITRDGDRAQRVSAPLTREGMEVLQAMLTAEAVSVRLMGDAVYTAELDSDTANSRRRIEAASLDGLGAGVALLREAGADEYVLWDLSAAAWEREYGFVPAFAKSEVIHEIGGVTVDDDFGMVERGDQTRAVKAAQEILAGYGFFSGSPSGTFGENSAAAVRRAQRWLGMVETGCMDARLETALAEGVCEEPAEEIVWQTLGETALVSLQRSWFAPGVSAANAPETVQSAYNTDNVLLAADGLIRNISGRELKLFTGLKAEMICGGVTFEAGAVCECSGKTALDMTLLPLAEARLIVYAEVPGNLVGTDAGWRIRLTAGDAVLEYELQ